MTKFIIKKYIRLFINSKYLVKLYEVSTPSKPFDSFDFLKIKDKTSKHVSTFDNCQNLEVSSGNYKGSQGLNQAYQD